MTLIYENYKGSQSGLAEITRHNWSNMVHGLSHWIFRTSNFHWSFQNHMLVIGGWRRQDKKKKKKKLWPIHPVELEEMEEMIDGDNGDGYELMDVDMPSSIRWKWECNGDDELVHFLLVYPSLTLSVLRQTSQTLLIKLLHKQPILRVDQIDISSLRTMTATFGDKNYLVLQVICRSNSENEVFLPGEAEVMRRHRTM